MSFRESYLESQVPTPYRVLGRVLRPYSLGHALLLQRIGSPYAVDGSVTADPEDLLTALIICSHTFADGLRLLGNQVAMDTEITAWRRPFRRLFRRVPIDMDAASSMFGDYLALGRATPQTWRRTGNGPGHTAPWEETVRLTLMRCGYSADDVLNMYLPALWYAFHSAVEMRMFDRARSLKDIVPVFATESVAEFIEHDRAARSVN